MRSLAKPQAPAHATALRPHAPRMRRCMRRHARAACEFKRPPPRTLTAGDGHGGPPDGRHAVPRAGGARHVHNAAGRRRGGPAHRVPRVGKSGAGRLHACMPMHEFMHACMCPQVCMHACTHACSCACMHEHPAAHACMGSRTHTRSNAAARAAARCAQHVPAPARSAERAPSFSNPAGVGRVRRKAASAGRRTGGFLHV